MPALYVGTPSTLQLVTTQRARAAWAQLSGGVTSMRPPTPRAPHISKHAPTPLAMGYSGEGSCSNTTEHVRVTPQSCTSQARENRSVLRAGFKSSLPMPPCASHAARTNNIDGERSLQVRSTQRCISKTIHMLEEWSLLL